MQRELSAGGGVTLRPLDLSDGAPLFALIDRNREHLGPWMMWVPATQSAHDVDAFVRRTLAETARGATLAYTIRRGDELVGAIDAHGIEVQNRRAEIGYWLAQTATGSGTMTAAVGALVGHAHAACGLHRIEILVATGNTPSCNVAERAGFTREAVLRDRIVLHGRFHDAALYVRFPQREPNHA